MVSSLQTRQARKSRLDSGSNGRGTGQSPDLPFLELPWHADVWTALRTKARMVALIGEPGTGKTTFAHHAAFQATGHRAEEIPGSPEIDRYDILGRQVDGGERIVFENGPLIRAIKNGWLIVEDFSAIPVDVRSIFLGCDHRTEFVNPLTNEAIKVPGSDVWPGFKILVTSNEQSLSCRKNAALGRFTADRIVWVDIPPLTDRQCRELLRLHFPNASEPNVERALGRWNEYRDITHKGESGKTHLSIRAAMNLLDLLEAGMREKRAVEIALCNKFLAVGEKDLYDVSSVRTSVGFESDEESIHKENNDTL